MSGKPLRISFLQPHRDAFEVKPGASLEIGRAAEATLRLEIGRAHV